MIRAMRTAIKPVIWIVMLAFGGWGVVAWGMDMVGGGGVTLTETALRVNGETVDLQTFYLAVSNAQEQQRTQYGFVPVTLEDQRAIEDQVVDQLIQDILLRQEFKRRGIRVSEQEIIQAARNQPPPEVLNVPDFQTEGQFDLQKYQRYIATGSDPAFLQALEARYRQQIPQTKLYNQLTTDLYVSDAELWQLYRDQHDTVVVRVLDIRPETAIADTMVTVSDQDARAYYQSHREEFRRPAVAFLSYLTVSRRPNALDSAAALELAHALKQEIDAGGSFEDIAIRESADSVSGAQGGDLGMQPNTRFVSEFTDAARALRPGAVSEPVLSQFGYHIIRLEAIKTDSVHARHILVPIELTGDHLDAVDARADSLDRFAAEQTDPTALDEVATMLDLPIRSTGAVVQGNRVVADGEIVPDAGLWAFERAIGETSLVIETPNTFYLFRLDSLRQAGIPPFDQVQSGARRGAMADKKWTQARALADTIYNALAAGQPLMDAAVTNFLGARTYGPMTRAQPDPLLRAMPKVVGAAFGGAVGQARRPIETDLGIFIVETASKQLADSSAWLEQLATQRAGVMQAIQQERVQLFLASLRNNANIDDRRRDLERRQRAQQELLADQPQNMQRIGF